MSTIKNTGLVFANLSELSEDQIDGFTDEASVASVAAKNVTDGSTLVTVLNTDTNETFILSNEAAKAITDSATEDTWPLQSDGESVSASNDASTDTSEDGTKPIGENPFGESPNDGSKPVGENPTGESTNTPTGEEPSEGAGEEPSDNSGGGGGDAITSDAVSATLNDGAVEVSGQIVNASEVSGGSEEFPTSEWVPNENEAVPISGDANFRDFDSSVLTILTNDPQTVVQPMSGSGSGAGPGSFQPGSFFSGPGMGTQSVEALVGKYMLGTPNRPWKSVWAQIGVILNSDQKHKHHIKDSDLGLDFVMSLRPVSFKLRVEAQGARHYGFVAQELKPSLRGRSFAGLVDSGNGYGVVYSELIAPLVKAVQEQQKQIEELKAQVRKLLG